MKDITLKDLLEAGCHFGHQSNRWHPKANSYIYGERDGVHIIDLAQTRSGLMAAGAYLTNLAKTGGSVIFVGTKRQAKDIVAEAAKRIRDGHDKDSNFFFLLERWPGGLLTNFDVMTKNMAKMSDLILKSEDSNLTKKERLLAKREHDKLDKFYGGLVGMAKLPDAVILIDPKKEQGSVAEAQKTGVQLVAICDTNCNPDPINFQIPANDDAVGSIKIITDYLADSWIEGLGEKAKEAEKVANNEKKAMKNQETRKQDTNNPQ